MKSTFRREAVLAVAAIFFLDGAAAGAGKRLTEPEIVAAFTDITLDGVYYDGSYFTETYHEDGSIRYWDARAADSGEWSVQDDQFCTFYAGQQGACFFVQRDGDNCFTFFEKDADTGELAADWTSRGWNRERPPTCPEAPEVGL